MIKPEYKESADLLKTTKFKDMDHRIRLRQGYATDTVKFDEDKKRNFIFLAILLA
jgi:hypothetical protein